MPIRREPGSAPGTTFEILEPTLVVVEGTDDQALFARLAQGIGLSDAQIIDAHGKTNIRARVAAIVNTDGFESVTGVGLVRDADDDPPAALDSLIGALRDAGLPAPVGPLVAATTGPLTTAVLVLPGNGATGELEDLCLAALHAHPHLQCVAEYIACIEAIAGPLPKGAKARVHAFLAGMPQPQRSTAVAIDKGYIPIAEPAFDDARNFLHLIT